MYTELDLGQAEDALVRLERNPIVAGHREFEPAAQCETVDNSHGGTGQGLKFVQDLLSEPDQLIGLLRILDRRELVDVRAHHEAVALA